MRRAKNRKALARQFLDPFNDNHGGCCQIKNCELPGPPTTRLSANRTARDTKRLQCTAVREYQPSFATQYTSRQPVLKTISDCAL